MPYLIFFIIFEQKKAKDHLGIDGDENSMMYEDNVQPAKWVKQISYHNIICLWVWSVQICAFLQSY